MRMSKCYFCGSEDQRQANYALNSVFVECPVCGRYEITTEFATAPALLDMTATYLYHHKKPHVENVEAFYYYLGNAESIAYRTIHDGIPSIGVTPDDVKTFYPSSFATKTDYILKTLKHKCGFMGNSIEMSLEELRVLLIVRRYNDSGQPVASHVLDSQVQQMKKALEEKEYVKISQGIDWKIHVELLHKGYEYIEQQPTENANTGMQGMFSSAYLDTQIRTMNSLQDDNPTEAIGIAKELIESCCKTIMEERAAPYDNKWQFDRLVSETLNLMGLKAKNVNEENPEIEAVKKMLGSLRAIAESVNQLRNSHGGGHGKPAGFQVLAPKYAHLTVGASSTFVRFLWETHKEQMQS
ncbi:abortive infection family protein [Pseudobutyrivibrio sp.]|uniref:abortive infection family protein n=1 Tax=Pseudobutyrivibrio sp. TaxID=2014367 RepID=UPI00386AB8D1